MYPEHTPSTTDADTLDLATALELVDADAREWNPEFVGTIVGRIEMARSDMTHDDVEVVEDPLTAAAYHMVLDASESDLNRAYEAISARHVAADGPMDLTTAIGLAADNVREMNPELTGNLADTITVARELSRDDIEGAVDDPRVRLAYHMVLNATADELTQVYDATDPATGTLGESAPATEAEDSARTPDAPVPAEERGLGGPFDEPAVDPGCQGRIAGAIEKATNALNRIDAVSVVNQRALSEQDRTDSIAHERTDDLTADLSNWEL